MRPDPRPLPGAIRAANRPEIRQAWCGPSLLILDTHGRAESGPPFHGFFFRETRYLSRLRLLVNGEEPVCASSAEVESAGLEFSFTYPPVETRGGGGSGSGGDHERFGIPSRGLDLDLRFRVLPASIDVTLAVTSRWKAVEFGLAWELGADFAGLMEAMADERQQDAPVSSEAVDGG